ncbi:MAG TPA: FAD-dependent monooxygenase [Solirubrobacteraceae bacterium]|nr:FAD-dependent monooxygenase [Solirubrobacteraceae bacterium]
MADNGVLIIGAGIGGLSLAVGLTRKGVPISVHESQPEVKEIGTGTGIQRVAQTGLELLGLSAAAREIGGQGFQELRLKSYKRGRTMASIPRRGEAFVVHRGELVEMLKRELGDLGVIRCNSQCVGFEQDGDGVTARFADGSSERGIALVGADGVRSIVRGQVVGDGPPVYSTQTAWRGMPVYTHPTLPLNISEQVLGPKAIFGLFPCNERLFWWASEVRPEGQSDPPDGRKQDLLRTFAGWPEGIPEVIEATPEEQIYRGDLYHRKPVDSWRQGRVVLLGDAAHPTMPAFGQGAGMAIEDAAVLSRELGAAGDLQDASALAAAFDRYESLRIPRTSAIVDRARRMARLCAWESAPAVAMREAMIASVPQRMWLRTYEHEHTYQL